MTSSPEEVYDWQPYLRAGLPLPSLGTGQNWGPATAEASVGDFADLDSIDAAAMPSTTTIRDAYGFPVGMFFGPSHRYLTRARALRWSPARYHSAARDEDGFLRGPATVEDIRGWMALEDGERELSPNGEEPDSPDEPIIDSYADRLVTVDSSVLVAGLDAGVFGPRDVLFVSAAVALDAAAALMEVDGKVAVSNWGWTATTPVPIDQLVLENFSRLCGMNPGAIGAGLDRIDMLVAATARLYDAVLFTAKPEAYRILGNEVRVQRFSPTTQP